MNTQEAKRLGPIVLASGVSHFNVITFLYAAFIAIAMLAGMNFLQPYLLSTHLQLADADMGKVTGTLAVITEIVTVLFIVPIGALTDRIGRRPLIVAGIFLFGLGYVLSGFATSLLELYLYRLFFYAFGAACLATTLATINNDYPQEMSRGKLIGISNVMSTLGVAFVTLVIAKIPEQLTAKGWEPVAAGEVMFLVAGGLCFISAALFQCGLKPGIPTMIHERSSFKTLVLSGFRNGRNPRILLSYAAAFTARGDLALKGVFISAWATVAAPDLGLTRAEALGAVGVLVGLTNMAAGLLWNPIFGWIMDRLNRVTSLALAMGIAAIGFSSMALYDDPTGIAIVPALLVLAMGASSALGASITLVGQEAPANERGSVIAANGLFGAIGIGVAVPLGGFLFDEIGPTAPFVMIGGLQAVLCILSIVVRIAAPGLSIAEARARVKAN